MQWMCVCASDRWHSFGRCMAVGYDSRWSNECQWDQTATSISSVVACRPHSGRSSAVSSFVPVERLAICTRAPASQPASDRPSEQWRKIDLTWDARSRHDLLPTDWLTPMHHSECGTKSLTRARIRIWMSRMSLSRQGKLCCRNYSSHHSSNIDKMSSAFLQTNLLFNLLARYTLFLHFFSVTIRSGTNG